MADETAVGQSKCTTSQCLLGTLPVVKACHCGAPRRLLAEVLTDCAIIVGPSAADRQAFVGVAAVYDGRARMCGESSPSTPVRDATEAELRATQERLDLALDGANLGIWDWDVTTGSVNYDRRWAEMLGYQHDEISPTFQTWENLIHPDDLPRALAVVDAHLQGRTEFLEIEHRLRHSDGSWVWVSSRGKVSARDANGRPLRATGTHLNIHRRKLEELARQVAEAELRQRAQEMELLLQSMSSAFVVWRTELDAVGNLENFYFDYFNDAYARVSGLTLEQVRGKSVREVWPETEHSWYEVYAEVARTGATKSFEMYHAPTSGLYACSAYRLPHPEDRICVVFQDVSERKVQLERLRELTSQQQAILSAVPAGVTFVLHRRVQWFNPEFARMFGYELDELSGVPSTILYANEVDYERVGREGYATIEAGSVYSTEIPFKRKDGCQIWCHLTGQAVDVTDPGRGSIWTFNDVTERRMAEAALRESELRFKRLVQYSNDIIVMIDGNAEYLSVSDSAMATLGYEPEELVGSRVTDFVHPDDVGVAAGFLQEIAQNPGVPRRVELRYRHKSDCWVPLEVVGTNLLSESSVRGIVINARDISERHRLTGQLQQAMKMEAIGRLAGGIAHDFNNLLSVISGNLELMAMDLAPDQSTRELLKEAASGVERAAALTRQLLAFSRRQIIEPKFVDLNALVGEVRRLLVRVIGEDIVLDIRLAKDLGTVRVDPGQFEQVLVNLVVNARDAMPSGGNLIVETSNIDLDSEYQRLHPDVTSGRYVLLAVSDTGIGMDVHVKQRLFEPFFTTKPKGRGTGLGLATAFGIVKQAGGSIEVYSELGRGTTFKIYLPRQDAIPDRLVVSSPASRIPTGTETILLVEDDEGVRNLSQKVLRRLGYSVLVANGGAEALKLAAQYHDHIHLLITDVVMPGLNGREVANRLTSIHPEARLLFVSGYTEDIIVHHGVIDGYANFISKPYAVQALALKIREVLA